MQRTGLATREGTGSMTPSGFGRIATGFGFSLPGPRAVGAVHRRRRAARDSAGRDRRRHRCDRRSLRAGDDQGLWDHGARSSGRAGYAVSAAVDLQGHGLDRGHATGRAGYLIPGVVDTHVHFFGYSRGGEGDPTTENAILRMLVANGAARRSRNRRRRPLYNHPAQRYR